MSKTPTYFDWMVVREELRGVESIEERRAIVSKHVLANTRNFHRNNAGFAFDYGTPRARELWAYVEETAAEVERGEKSPDYLSGAIQVWQVGICEEYTERRQAKREAMSRVAAAGPAERPPAAGRKEVAAGEGANGEGVPAAAAEPKRRAPSRPARTTPAPPAPSPQGSLFG